jgi:uncharacterized protein (TIGR02284 family)
MVNADGRTQLEVAMAEHTERSVLNHLIETCRDAERGLRVAADNVNSPKTRRMLLALAEQRHAFADDLLPHAQRLGGAGDADGTAAAAVHRAWIQVKARLASDRDNAVLQEAARGERYAMHAYDDAVTEVIPPDVRDLVEGQDLGVRVARRLVSGLVK